MIRQLALAAVLAMSCGPRGSVSTTPVLPDEEPPLGDEQGEKPPTPAPVPPRPEEDVWAKRTDLVQPPPPARPRALDLPKLERFVLPNGLAVVVVPMDHAPVVSYQLAVRAGTADEPRDKRALADITAALIVQGTKTRSAEQLASEISNAGGAIAAVSDYETTQITCQTLSKLRQTCATLLADVVTAPTFPDAGVQQIRDSIAAELKRIRETPTKLAGEHMENLLWGESHVRGWPATVDDLRNIKRADVVAFHAKWFVPSNATLVVAGDVNPAALKKELTAAFKKWGGKKAPARKRYAEPKLAGRVVRVVDRPDQQQAVVLVGELGIAHNDASFPEYLLLNHILGQGPASRLSTALKKDGKPARVSSAFERWATRGSFEVTTVVPNDAAADTVDAILAEVARLRDEGPTEKELAEAKRAVIGGYGAQFQRSSDVAAAVLSAELHKLGEAYVRDFAVRVDAVTVDGAKKAAKKLLGGQNVAVVISGRAAEIAPKLDEKKVAYEKVHFLEPISRTEREELARKKKAPPDPAKTAAGKKLLDAALEAKGGKDKLVAVKDITVAGTVRLGVSGQNLEGALKRIVQVPSRLRLDVTVYGQTISMVIDDDEVWQKVGERPAESLPTDMVAQARDGLWRDRDLILLRHLSDDTVVQAAGQDQVGDKKYDAVVIRHADGTGETRILLDPATRHIFRIVYEEGGERALEEYGDYREVDGLWFAFKQRAVSPEQSFEVTVKSVTINSGIPPAVFDKK